MSDVPSDVLREILLRLPAESLFRFRTVCKSWRRLIDDPSFVKAHTNNQLSSNTLLIRQKTGSPLYSFDLDSLNFIVGLQTIPVTPREQLARCGLPPLPVAVCNGLILIARKDIKKVWAILNPLTHECLKLPQLNTDLHLIGGGFGYDYAADDYKVVRIDELCRQGKVVCQTHVYSLKSDSWRMIEDFPCDSLYMNGLGVFLNGALHWRSRDMIIVLHLERESYSQMPLPPVFTGTEIYRMHLDVLGGCLIMSYFCYRMNRFEGWLMNDYSWMNKKQVFLQGDDGFFWFDIESNSGKKVSIHGLSGISSSQICPGSLFRLLDNFGVSGSVAAKRT